MNNEINGQIGDIMYNDVIIINNIAYKIFDMKIAHMQVPIILPVDIKTYNGMLFSTDNWEFTNIYDATNTEIIHIGVIAYDIKECTDENFIMSQYLNGAIVGKFLNSDKCYLRKIGKRSKDFYMATIKVVGVQGHSFDMPIIAFGNQAITLSEVEKYSIIKCNTTLKCRREGDGYELAAYDINVA